MKLNFDPHIEEQHEHLIPPQDGYPIGEDESDADNTLNNPNSRLASREQ